MRLSAAPRLDLTVGPDRHFGATAPTTLYFPDTSLPGSKSRVLAARAEGATRRFNKAIIDRRRWTILGRAIAPATATFQHVHDAADDAAIVRPLDAPYIRR